ncbi:MAG: DUF6602 domain-containing protein [Candidatus Brocadiia bacterium]
MGEQAGERWVEGHTLGRKRLFWWRVDEDGNLLVKRSGRDGRQREAVAVVRAEELRRLERWMADGQWHPLAAGPHAVGSGAEGERGLGAFLHGELGWPASATVLASHLAAALVEAEAWTWNGRKKGAAFRQAKGGEGLAARLRAGYRRLRPAPKKPRTGKPRRRGRQQPPRFSLEGKFLALSRSLRARFEECGSGGQHGPEKGRRREGAMREFLRAQLPGRYAVGRGEVVASMGEASRQADVLIYDALHTPVLVDSGGSQVLPVECVYAVVEVKPRLTPTTLRAALENVWSVKCLSRSVHLGPRGAKGDIEAPIYGAIFSLEGMDHRSLLAELRRAQDEWPVAMWVDFVCVLDQAVAWRDAAGAPTWSPEGAWATSFITALAAGPHSLLLFYLSLMRDVNAKNPRPPDLMHYAQRIDLPPPLRG